MSLNDTASAERLHIGFFGARNAGKSSLVNAVTGQSLSVVADVPGTTTDPVKKAMEILPLGPVVIVDTPGFDDEGRLGELRVERTREVLRSTDIAVLVADGSAPSAAEEELVRLFEEKKLPYAIAVNKADLLTEEKKAEAAAGKNRLAVSALTGEGVHELKELLGGFAKGIKTDKPLVRDLLSPGDTAVLVVPIDESAPKGRLILPQQQTMRELLDSHCPFVTCGPQELADTLALLKKPPRIVITDSQAFEEVARVTPENIMLTSFSILFARYKGELAALTAGAKKLSNLKDGERVLVCEGCTHHRQCNDIGTVKLPAWVESYAKAKPAFEFTSGGEFPRDLSGISLIVHCGGCMLNQAEMKSRLESAREQGVDIVNYGVAIAAMHGILARSLKPFPEAPAALGDR